MAGSYDTAGLEKNLNSIISDGSTPEHGTDINYSSAINPVVATGAGVSSRNWRDDLPRLEPLILPLLPCGAGAELKGPIDPMTGYGLKGWTAKRFTVPEILAMNGKVICAGTRTGAGLLAFDVDGGSAVELLLEHGCDPQKAETWQIHRNTDHLRLKLLWQLSEEQQAALGAEVIAAAPTAKPADGKKGEALELFHSPKKQVVVLGEHRVSGGHYFWPEGHGPEALSLIPEAWWSLALKIAREETEDGTKTPAAPKRSSPKGEWIAINPCPICGRNTTGWCTRRPANGAINCRHGNSFSPVLAHGVLKRGQVVMGTDGVAYAFCQEKWQSDGQTVSNFVVHKERAQPPAEHPQDRQEATPLFEPPASLGELFNALPDGWVTSREGPRLSPLSPGLLARNLEQLGEWLRFNELALKAEVLTTRGWQVVQDEHLNDAMVQLSQNGWTIAQELVDKAVNYVARQRSIHPVREYLLSLESRTDLEPFDLDEVAPRFFKTTNPLHIAMWRKWLIGAAARALDPGCQMDYVLVLHSASQGMKKSSAFGVLGNGYHTSSVPDNDKDFILNLHSHWLFELAELDHVTSKRASGHLKNLITTRQDSFRVPYGRTTQKRPRQSVFCGTVNRAEFLKDETGNRRYWVVPLEAEVDLPALEKARDAIWLGAVRAHRAGELPMLSREQEQASEGQNASHLAVDPWADHVEALLKGSPTGRPVRVPDVLSHLHIPLERHTREAARRVCAIAEGLGWVHDRRTVKGQKLQGLWPPSEQVVASGTPSTGHPRTPQDTPRGVQANASDASASQLQDTPDTPFSPKVQKGDMNPPEGGAETTPAKRPSPMFEEMGCLGCPPQQSNCNHTLFGVSGGVSVGCPGVSSGVSLEENKRSTRKPPITEEELERAFQAAIASGNLRKFLPDEKGHPPLATTEVDPETTCHRRPPEAEPLQTEQETHPLVDPEEEKRGELDSHLPRPVATAITMDERAFHEALVRIHDEAPDPEIGKMRMAYLAANTGRWWLATGEQCLKTMESFRYYESAPWTTGIS
jgi:predicted P-loop ATPase